MVSFGIDGDAMRIGIDLKVGQPKIRPGIDDAHHGKGKHIAGSKIVLIVARIVPNLVDAADIIDVGDSRERSPVDDNFVGREGFAIVICATYQEIVAGTLNDAGGHAIQHRHAVDHHESVRIAGSGIDLIYRADIENSGGIRVR